MIKIVYIFVVKKTLLHRLLVFVLFSPCKHLNKMPVQIFVKHIFGLSVFFFPRVRNWFQSKQHKRSRKINHIFGWSNVLCSILWHWRNCKLWLKINRPKMPTNFTKPNKNWHGNWYSRHCTVLNVLTRWNICVWAVKLYESRLTA